MSFCLFPLFSLPPYTSLQSLFDSLFEGKAKRIIARRQRRAKALSRGMVCRRGRRRRAPRVRTNVSDSIQPRRHSSTLASVTAHPICRSCGSPSILSLFGCPVVTWRVCWTAANWTLYVIWSNCMSKTYRSSPFLGIYSIISNQGYLVTRINSRKTCPYLSASLFYLFPISN